MPGEKTYSLVIKLYGAVERGDDRHLLCAFGQAWFNTHTCWLEFSVGVVILFVCMDYLYSLSSSTKLEQQ